jgi:tetratricopeptide (TPR) repeat protein
MKKVILVLFLLAVLFSRQAGAGEAKGLATEQMKSLVQSSAFLYWSQGKYHEAIEELNKIIKREPMNVMAYSLRASSYSGLGNHGRAVEDYGKAIKIGNRADDYCSRGKEYADMGNNGTALEGYNQAITMDAQGSSCYSKRGDLYALMGYPKRAIEDYSKAIEASSAGFESLFQPLGSSLYSSRGYQYYASADYQKAVDDYSEAIKLNPDPTTHGFNYFFRGQAYSQLGNYKAAIQDYNKASKTTNQVQSDELFVNRGFAYLKVNAYLEGIEDYTRAIEINPGNALSYKNRAFAYNALGRKDQAIEDYRSAAKLGDKESQAILDQTTQRENSVLRLLCTLVVRYNPPMQLSFKVDLASSTVNGYRADITEDTISWTREDMWFKINRYTGMIDAGETGSRYIATGKCVKAAEKQF